MKDLKKEWKDVWFEKKENHDEGRYRKIFAVILWEPERVNSDLEFSKQEKPQRMVFSRWRNNEENLKGRSVLVFINKV